MTSRDLSESDLNGASADNRIRSHSCFGGVSMTLSAVT